MQKAHLKKEPASRSRFGHPWIYRSQIAAVPGKPEDGELVRVLSAGDRFMGIGYYNSRSEIALRLLSRRETAIDKAFFARKISAALEYRKRLEIDSNACRLISSEADGLPGLIVDRYDETLVVQFLTLGMERLRPLVMEALGECVPSRGVFEKSDSGSRRLEGLEPKTGWLSKECATQAAVREGDVRYLVSFEAGHKTGLYLDQRENRFFLRDFMKSGEILDAFCYEGGFGLHLAKKGCRVLGLDSQADAIARATENRRLNGLSEANIEFKATNVFDELRELERARRKFDLVVLDPPSFVKRKQALAGAMAGYKEILLRSMKILKDGGLLAVFSCSYHVDENLLMQASLSAAADVRRSLKLVKFMKQAGDHPIDPFIPETYYLKGFLFSVFPFE